MTTHSSVLAWRIPGTGEPGGLPSMGFHRVRHDWSDLAAAGTQLEGDLENETPSLRPFLFLHYPNTYPNIWGAHDLTKAPSNTE